MKYYSIGKFSKLIGKTEQTLRNWDKKGILKPSHISESGYRYYSQQQLNHFLGIKNQDDKNRKIIGYCRVLNNKQKDALDKQIENVKTYMYAKGYQFEIISDIGSGVNYSKNGLDELINLIINSEVEKIVILYKDRLIRIGFELIESLCKKYGTSIEIIDNTQRSEEKELIEDMIQVINTFSNDLQGKKASNSKRLIKGLIEYNFGKES